MVVKAEAIYEGGTYQLVKDNQTGLYIAKEEALARKLKNRRKVQLYRLCSALRMMQEM